MRFSRKLSAEVQLLIVFISSVSEQRITPNEAFLTKRVNATKMHSKLLKPCVDS